MSVRTRFERYILSVVMSAVERNRDGIGERLARALRPAILRDPSIPAQPQPPEPRPFRKGG